MITFSDAYKFAAYSSVTDERWYAKLYYDDAGANDFLGIASEDMLISGVQYYGIVLSWGEILDTINIKNSSAAISDMGIDCANNLKSGMFSDVLYGGSNKYINRKFELFSYLNSTSIQLYTGKLVRVSASDDIVSLSIEGYKPWDKISIPSTKSLNGNYEPVSYGDFVQDTNTNFFTSKFLYPMPFEYRKNNNLYFVAGRTLATGAEIYFYDSGIDKFIEFSDSASATISAGDAYLTSIPIKCTRVTNFRPSAEGTDDFSATASAYDEDSDGSSNNSTSARYPSSGEYEFDNTASGTAEVEDYELILSGVPEPIGKPTAIYLKGRASVSIVDGGEADDKIILGHDLYGGGFTTTGISRD